jgi:hypothetical protein
MSHFFWSLNFCFTVVCSYCLPHPSHNNTVISNLTESCSVSQEKEIEFRNEEQISCCYMLSTTFIATIEVCCMNVECLTSTVIIPKCGYKLPL